MPGVLAVFTGADIAAAGLGGLPCGWGVTDRHGKPMAEPAHPLLVQDIVRHVGDNVAMVTGAGHHARPPGARRSNRRDLGSLPRSGDRPSSGGAAAAQQSGRFRRPDRQEGTVAGTRRVSARCHDSAADTRRSAPCLAALAPGSA
jgi:hypothetical protein